MSNVEFQLFPEQMRRREQLEYWSRQGKALGTHHTGEHGNHVAHGCVVERSERIATQAKATHEIVPANSQRDDALVQSGFQGLAKLHHCTRIVNITCFQGWHEVQVRVADRAFPERERFQCQLRQDKSVHMLHQQPSIQHCCHLGMAWTDEEQRPLFRAPSSVVDAHKECLQVRQRTFDIGRSNSIFQAHHQ